MMKSVTRTIAASWTTLLWLSLFASTGWAQCPPADWLPSMGRCGTNGDVESMILWDPDGDGPATHKVIVGGAFTSVCNVTAMNVAMYDPDTNQWSPMGAGLGTTPFGTSSERVTGFAVQPNGRLFAVGRFASTGGMSAGSVARWTGSQWLPVGVGVQSNTSTGIVNAVVCMPNGDIVVGGLFNATGSIQTMGLARWDGDTWSGFGTGVGGESISLVESLDVMPNGNLLVGGRFTNVDGVPATYVAQWNGATWSAIGPGRAQWVKAVKALPDGGIVATGINLGTTARWDGVTWTDLGFDAFDTFAVLSNGDLLGGRPGALLRWGGSDWVLEAQTPNDVYSIVELPDGGLMIGGWLLGAGGEGVSNIARRRPDGTWMATCDGFNGDVAKMATMPNGDVVVAGEFTRAGNINAKGIARWDGNAWHSMNSSSWSAGEYITGLAAMPNGDIVVAGTAPALGLSRWNGQTWESLGGAYGWWGLIAALPNGDLVTTYAYQPNPPNPVMWVNGMGRWDGTNWHRIPDSFGPDYPNHSWGIRSIAAMPNGDIILGGGFGTSPTGAAVRGVARWNGTSWLPMGNGLGVTGYESYTVGVAALLPLPNGRVIAGGDFSTGSGASVIRSVALWNGQFWQPMGSGLTGTVSGLCQLPGGDIVATGEFTVPNYPDTQGIARWNGTEWRPMGTGLGGSSYSRAGRALAVDRHGNLLVGGEFETVNSQIGARFARFGVDFCPADLDDGAGQGARDCSVTIDDLLYFLSAFETGTVVADLDDGSGTGSHDGAVTIDDLLFFLARFEAGC